MISNNRTSTSLDSWLARWRWESLPTVLAAHAQLTPGAPAVISGDRIWTYAALHSRAASIARQLTTAGAGPNRVVALIADRGAEQVAGLMGILASGAACLPIDPRWPEDLQEQVMAGEGVALSLGATRIEKRASRSKRAPAALPAARPGESQLPEDLLYVGRGGRADGTALVRHQVDHGTGAIAIAAFNRRFDVGTQDTLLSVLPIGAAFVPHDPLAPLAAGGTLVLPSGLDEAMNPTRWLELVGDYEVTVLAATSQQLAGLAREASGAHAELLGSLRLVVAADRVIPPELRRALRRLLPDAALINIEVPPQRDLPLAAAEGSASLHRHLGPVGGGPAALVH
jgi:non-ribosomal peptide synthetase component F